MNTKQPETFGSTIKKVRLEAGLSLGQAADLAEISKSLLRFWELDQVASPDLAKLQKLASVLNLEPVDLAELAGYKAIDTLPPMQPYLRSKYPNLPNDALNEIAAITTKYGIDPNQSGPRPGEDET